MSNKTYTADQVKEMLDQSMKKFRSSMVGLIRECGRHPRYRDLKGGDALALVADKLEELK